MTSLRTPLLITRSRFLGPRSSHRYFPSSSQLIHTAPRQPAFAFDIDGVLLKGKRVLPEGKRALRRIIETSKPSPFILLTNGGGITEEEKAHDLSQLLEVEICPSQLVMAHSPMKSLVPEYGNKGVLILGGHARQAQYVAKTYGFRKTIIPEDIYRWNPSIWPFKGTPHLPEDSTISEFSTSTDSINAIMAFHDSRDWGTDIQITLDALTAKDGRLTADDLAVASSQQVPIFFSNPDLIWSNDFPSPRLAQGAARYSLMSLFKALTGHDLVYTMFGKPTKATYDYAEKTLAAQAHRMGISAPLRVFGIGDNPPGDIAGAKAHGWDAILVRTGVFKASPGQNDPNYPADWVVEDAEEAVDVALKQCR